jgi:phage terminase large subunit
MMTESDHFAAAARLAGCPHDQMENFIRAGVVLQQKQLAASAAARLCDRPDGPTAVGFGGARGGGKSFWLLAQMGLDDCQRVAGLKCLLLRKVGKSNLENFEDLRRRLFRRLPHEFAVSRGLLTFANGSRIISGHFQCEKDIDAYLGLEYDIIGIEEATTLTSRKYHDIVTCCRTSKILADGQHWRPRIYSTTNPGGVGHNWFRIRYVTPFQRRQEIDTRFISATVDDNSFTNPGYRDTLDGLTGWQKRAWRYGDWVTAAALVLWIVCLRSSMTPTGPKTSSKSILMTMASVGTTRRTRSATWWPRKYRGSRCEN